MSLDYIMGFEMESEAPGYEGALPRGQINPQRCNRNLVAEQLSGSAFTAPRSDNKRSWFYRLRPSVGHSLPVLLKDKQLDYESGEIPMGQMRWTPFEASSAPLEHQYGSGRTDFVDGLQLLAFSESARHGGGQLNPSVSIFIYFADKDMVDRSFVNHDGDFLIVPQECALMITTEFGILGVAPNEIAVIQQGMKFQVKLDNDCGLHKARGYILEVTGNHFELPNLGPIGANCLANPRDFRIPKAAVQPRGEHTHEIVGKHINKLLSYHQDHSPYDVAAWFGNYVPYKYDLVNFVSVNSPGTALADFVIFPPRWECAQNTFRPPYYHRNCMTEFMGLIKGQYQAKSKAFAPGGASLHGMMMPHGPDKECFELASKQDTSVPKRVADDTMAFMFETSLPLKLTRWARECNVDKDYLSCWSGL